ncbi:LLM class flavin-dependent oxidoreductase [Amycolatopsis sp. H6(2020)]|uniref:MupA/Atu3671 family FMN-dependent luciferase-like monooxygenase n=1 Tax=Amycolatopsis kentuckyensis TaxID=218823 RepID=UPI000A3C1DED|nr:MupA/Atu3671 family FMN-dependent luciferase-like monooxygenase [Amycolatopsis kentuckyensis]MBE8524853.1 LLM class flavin-dependent oxidoreductase [Amycolatopsis sp. H6(2020)]
MDFSLFYFANDSTAESGDRYELLLEGAKFADRNDFAAVWTPERHFHPFGGLYPNPAVTGAAVAAVTERVAIRAGSVVAPLHHPARIAEEWAVVDNISGGRVGLSFASGWHASDFVLSPDSYADRRRLVVEHAEQVRALWRGEEMSGKDGAGTLQRFRTYPRPVQANLPIWLTSGGSVDTFRAAGALGAGLLTHLLGQDVGQLAEKIAAYREAVAQRPDADGWPGHVVLMVHTFLGTDEDRVRDQVRPALSEYIRSSLGLILGSQLDGKRRVDPAKLPPDELDFLVEHSFRRYFDDGGLLGTVPKALGVARRLAETGVDEVACLVDFGLDTKTVLAGFDHLDELRRQLP